ncbi:uncharacterized protein PHACADRAFT_123217 [Phanerochaete carnosa HHB-10118-sp]|uniref:DUF6533 domain-containing protein n=1 Tax=Phanerochaete carnosa (strain HHB-10118-sp) TaxID=650164 RepID=K5VS07_PHACS|nr:uncharacterized protein PHACADRAFT_123217 [Phanerochaete carnosa HHB-10118-sp]EKM54283.1 hypothetical protein PHACADRAFT_123217 [Phanerochaete carnosa HHB-10118-sp]
MSGTGTSLDVSVVRYFYLKQVTSYSTTSSMLLLLHDFLSSFNQEVELVWLSPWSPPKIVYLVNRYSSIIMGSIYLITLFFGAHTPTRCMVLGAMGGWQSWISTTLVQVVLQTWLYAIYNHNRRPLYIISAISALLSGAVIVSLMHYAFKLRFIMSYPICVQAFASSSGAGDASASLGIKVDLDSTTKFSPWLLAIYLTWMIFTIFLLVLIAYKVWRTFRQQVLTLVGPGDEGGSLARILLRDSLCYGGIIFVLVLMNMAMTIFAPTALYQVGYGFSDVLPCILSSRILLNLRGWEKYKEARANLQDVRLSEWPTMFHLTEISHLTDSTA